VELSEQYLKGLNVLSYPIHLLVDAKWLDVEHDNSVSRCGQSALIWVRSVYIDVNSIIGAGSGPALKLTAKEVKARGKQARVRGSFASLQDGQRDWGRARGSEVVWGFWVEKRVHSLCSG